MTGITLKPSSRRRTGVLIVGVCLMLAGIALTNLLGQVGWGFLAVWIGIILALNRLNPAVIAIFGGLGGMVVSLLAIQPWMAKEERRQALERKQAEDLRIAEDAKGQEALVTAFPQKRAEYEAAVAKLERLVAGKEWTRAESALRELDQTLRPLLASRIGHTAEVQALRVRVDRTGAVLAPKLAELRQTVERERAKAAAAAEFDNLRALLQSYDANEVAADARYKGRSIRVSGIVGDIKKDILNRPYVTLGTGAEFEIPKVQCFLAAAAVSQAASLRPGQMVALEGKVDGLMMNVLLSDCTIR